MAATPALSSAPNKVVPSVTIKSCPIYCSISGNIRGERTIFSASFNTISPPAYETIRGLTPSPDISGLVSKWEINPIVGTSWSSIFDGKVAIRYELSSKEISSKPKASSSFTNASAKTRWPDVLGVIPDSSSDCVAKVTYFRNLSTTVIFMLFL